jgi:hypothetical protein
MTPNLSLNDPAFVGVAGAVTVVTYENVEWNTSTGGTENIWVDSPPSTYRTGTNNSNWGGSNYSSTQTADPSGTLNELKSSFTTAPSKWTAIGYVTSIPTDGSPDTWSGYALYYLPASSGVIVYASGADTSIAGAYTSSTVWKLKISSDKAELFRDDVLVYTDTASLSGTYYIVASAYSTGTSATITGEIGDA